MKKVLLMTILLQVNCCFFVSAKNLELKEALSGAYSARTAPTVYALNDGERYATLKDGKQVVACSFKTGEQTEVLFDVATTKGDVTLSGIDGYIMSPDERKMLIQTQKSSIYRRSSTSIYYIYDIKNKTLEKLSDGGPQEVPAFSPDGTMVAFVREGNIFLVKLLFGNSESQVTKDGAFNEVINGKPDWVNEEEFSFSRAFTFNADNTMLCWIRYDEREVPLFSFPWYQGDAPKKTEYADYPGSYSYKYPIAGAMNAQVSVMSYDIKSHRARTLKVPVDADGYVPRIFATSDPEKICVVTQNRHQDKLELYMANPRSTECKLVVRDQVDKYTSDAVYQNFFFFDNGFVMMSERTGFTHLYLYDLNGRLQRTLTKGDFEVTDCYGYNPLTGECFYASREEGPLYKAVYKVDAKGKVTKLSTKKGTNVARFSKTFNYYFNTFSNTLTPPLVTLCNNKGKVLKTVEDNAALKRRMEEEQLPSPEFFSFTTSEGVSLNGWMLKPVDFDASKKYPVVMFQYSGPGSQQVKDAWAWGNYSGMYERYLTQQGFICVCVDGRGTGGRGAAFEKQTYLRLGLLEARDQVEAALYLGQQSYIDAKRIGIWGWSYGGFCTLMAMEEGRPVFAAGVAVAPVTNFRFYDSVYSERFMRTPKENKEGYDDNPMSRAKQLHGALLLCHGAADDNVHFRQTAEYTEALVQADKDFKQQIYTNRNHSIYGGNTRVHLFHSIAEWFKTNL